MPPTPTLDWRPTLQWYPLAGRPGVWALGHVTTSPALHLQPDLTAGAAWAWVERAPGGAWRWWLAPRFHDLAGVEPSRLAAMEAAETYIKQTYCWAEHHAQ